MKYFNPQQKPIALHVFRVRRHDTDRFLKIVARVVAIRELSTGNRSIRNFSDGGLNDQDIGELKQETYYWLHEARSQVSPDFDLGDVYSVDRRKALAAYHALHEVERRFERIKLKVGPPASAGQAACMFANAIFADYVMSYPDGAASIHGGEYDDHTSEMRWMSPVEAVFRINDWVAEADQNWAQNHVAA